MLTFFQDYLVRCVKSSSRDWIVRFELYTHVIAVWNDTKPRQIPTVAIADVSNANIIFGPQILRPNFWPVTLVWQLDYIIRCTSLTRLEIKVVEGDAYLGVERCVYYHPAMKGRKRQTEMVLSMTAKSIGYRKNDCSNRPSSIYQNSDIALRLNGQNCKILTIVLFCKSQNRLWENQTKYRNMTESLGVMLEF